MEHGSRSLQERAQAMVEENSNRKIGLGRSTCRRVEPRPGINPTHSRQASFPGRFGDVTLTRRDVLMATNAALLGAIAAAGAGNAQPPELPLLVDGLQGWISTTKGQFLFGDGTTAPGHGQAVHEARDIRNGQVLFSQATVALRPTWDATSFNVPCIRSNGTQYLTRNTALSAPGLVIIGCAFDAGSAGFRALVGARSTQTPAGDPAEDAWTLNKTSSNQLRALVATDTEIDFADTPAFPGEKLLVMMEEVENRLEVWHVGSTGQQTIIGTRIVADAEQALLAKYYDNAVTAILQGGIFEFAQYAPAPSREVRRLLVQYFQGLVWPAITPPIAATVNGGQVQQGANKSIDVVTPSSGSALVLASIDEQPAAGSLSVSGSNSVAISVPPGAPLGNYSGRYCLRSHVAGARLVDFGRVDFEVVEGGSLPELPYMGRFYGCGYCGPGGAANTEMRVSSELGLSQFFYAERDGTIDRLCLQKRTGEGYSLGTGGTYTIEIRTASATTKLPIRLSQGGQIISQTTGWQPGNPPNSSIYEIVTFTSTPGQVVAGQPYCLVFRNTHPHPTGNFFSTNVSVQAGWSGSAGSGSAQPSDYEEPSSLDPQSPGSSPAMVAGWSPVYIDGTEWHDWPSKAYDGQFQWNRLGPEHASVRYSDGQWVLYGVFPAGSIGVGTAILNGSSDMARQRFRVTRANRIVSGVFMRVVRMNNTSGNLIVTLEQGPTGDAHFPGNGTTIESVTVPHSTIPNVGAEENVTEFHANNGDGIMDIVPWIWVPFSQNRTLFVGTNYNLRLSRTGSLDCRMRCNGRVDHPSTGLGPAGLSVSTWAQWESQRNLPWTAWEDSRGFQVSTDSGSTWAYHHATIPILPPILFKCV
jgi:hypothetical protein